MKLAGARVILTGAAGGLGSEIAGALTQAGARIALLGRNSAAMHELSEKLTAQCGECLTFKADLLDTTERNSAIDLAISELGGIDLLINNAGMQTFRPFCEEDPVQLERTVRINTIAPMLTTHRVLPHMLQHNKGHIVNIGSTFGSIGFAWFTAYSASKFGLRGFSESLRRELGGTGVEVSYIAPRAVKTKLNSSAVYKMAEEVKMNMDEPKWVASRIVEGISRDRKELYLGFPESLFVRINALLPRLVDKALYKQNIVMSKFARGVMP
jgi:short-subunit dehydrogenase